MEIVLATTNVHKIREFRVLLHSIPQLDVLTLHQFPHYVPPEETESTFQGNASLKALHAAQALNKWVLADDTGLIIPALNGAPGVRSRRYAGNQANDKENRAKLLSEMASLAEYQRAAYYECALALANPEGIQKVCTSICEGMISHQERGSNGFGYDPLFYKHDYGEKTFAELTEDVKNRVSHRGKAVEKMLTTLLSIVNALPH